MGQNKEFWHKQIIDVDLPTIAINIQDFDEFYECFITAINTVMGQPLRPGWELKYDLAGWNEYKFFSTETPYFNNKPDMRFIYYYDRDFLSIYILAVGARNSKETRNSADNHSIYYIAANRLKNLGINSWQIIKK